MTRKETNKTTAILKKKKLNSALNQGSVILYLNLYFTPIMSITVS